MDLFYGPDPSGELFTLGFLLSQSAFSSVFMGFFWEEVEETASEPAGKVPY